MKLALKLVEKHQLMYGFTRLKFTYKSNVNKEENLYDSIELKFEMEVGKNIDVEKYEVGNHYIFELE